MRAAYITATGAPEQITVGELPTPEPGPNEVLVRIRAASLNPIDTYIRSGTIPMAQTFPYVPGCDLAGEVTAVGSNVTKFKVGDRVWGTNQSLFGRQGTFAEYIAVDPDWLYSTPDELTDVDAAAASLVGITAHLGLFLHGNLQAGEYLFVNGGTGGVGSMVIQFAKAAGAKVMTTAGTEEKRQLCRELGADVVTDYKSPTLEEEIKAFAEPNGGLDFWWETQREPTIERSIGHMKKRGRIVVMAGRDAKLSFTLGPFYVNDLRLIGFAMFNASQAEQQAAADEMNAWAQQKKWKAKVGQEFALDEAAAAHALQEANTLQKAGTLTGKIVVLP
ncbi:MAG: NADPH:quinone reductase [Planctomycetaceae bacterium]